MANEIWKDIKGYENMYQVSNQGRVRSLDRTITNCKGVSRIYKGQIIIPHYDKDGYVRVALNKDNKRRKFLVHRLVASAFIPNPNNLPQVNHKDENKSNNNSTNLEWCTAKYNIDYGTRNERSRQTNIKNDSYNKNLEKARDANKKNNYLAQKKVITSVHNSDKANKRKVICTTTNEVFDSMWEAEKKYNIYPNSIYKCCKGDRKTCGKLPDGTKLVWQYYSDGDSIE